MNIVFFSLKGGVGKTTLSYCVVSALVKAGQSVDFVDYDPQESASAWLAIDEFVSDPEANVRIVDTPPRADHKPTLEELKNADKVFIPCSPSMADIPAAQATLELVRKFAPKAQCYIVWSRVDARKKVKLRNMPAFAEHIGAPALSSYTRNLDCYENIGGAGVSALTSSAQSEILTLALEVLNV